MLIDTHCHLHDREFFTEEQAEEMLKRAREKGIEKNLHSHILLSVTVYHIMGGEESQICGGC